MMERQCGILLVRFDWPWPVPLGAPRLPRSPIRSQASIEDYFPVDTGQTDQPERRDPFPGGGHWEGKGWEV